jgi:hypothetical protein
MNERIVTANEVRIPTPLSGEAILVTKHASRVKAVVLHPADYERLGRLVDLLGDDEPYELRLTETALEAHRLGETGADELEPDFESLDLALSE